MTDYRCLSIFSNFFPIEETEIGRCARRPPEGWTTSGEPPPDRASPSEGCPTLDGKHRHDANLNLDVRGMTARLCPKLCPVAAWTC